jgi:hypothetical protein
MKNREKQSYSLILCRYCNAQVRCDRIQNHILKVHSKKKNKQHKQNNSYGYKKQVFRSRLHSCSEIISKWLDKHLHNYEDYEKIFLSIMLLAYKHKYDDCTLNKFLPSWEKNIYKQEFKELKKIFNYIKFDLYSDKKKFEEQKEQYKSKASIRWQEFNSYETRFGNKYIGYLRREYRGRRFGSYPLYDDHSEESNPE